jgi:AcrR family transcriptional regulator
MRTGQRDGRDQVQQQGAEPDLEQAESAGRRIRGLDAGQRRAQRRGQLLEAALELFARQSYARTTIEQICQTAFVGTKGFYELFDSKEACYLALLRQITQDAVEQVRQEAEAPEDGQDAAHRLIATFAHAVSDDPRKVKVAFGEGAGISPEVNRERRANRRWAAELVESVWERYGTGSGPARPGVDLHRMAVGLIGGLFDLVVDWVVESESTGGDSGADIESLVADLTTFYDLVRDGLDHPR